MFDAILRDLLEAVPGARGAVFCDPLGETVTSVGASGRSAPESLDDYDLRVAGAQFATPVEVMLGQAAQNLGTVRELHVTGQRESLLLQLLPDGYFLVLCLAPGALEARGRHHLRRAAERVAREM